MLADLVDMRFFVEVVKEGSITRAAKKMDFNRSSGSRRIQALEERLRVQLLKRNTRSVQTTEIGRAFYDRCVRILEEIELTEQMIGEESRTPRGTLRVALPANFGAPYISRWVTEFLALYPQLKIAVETGLGYRPVDLIAGSYDLWIKTGPVPDSGLTLKKLGTLSKSLYAAPGYLARHAPPQAPADLARHNCLDVSHEPCEHYTWSLVNGRHAATVQARGNLWLDNLLLLRGMVLAGLGIGILPDAYVRRDVARGTLVRVLPEWAAAPIEVSLLMPQRDLLPAKVRLFVDFIAPRMDELLSGR